MNTGPAVIEIKNLHRRFGKLDAVNGLNLRVRSGGVSAFWAATARGKRPPSNVCSTCCSPRRALSACSGWTRNNMKWP